MKPLRHHRRRDGRACAFTLIELLVVISIIGIIAGLMVGLTSLAERKMRLSRVKAELDNLVTAIDSYRHQFGTYPADNQIATAPDRSVPNQLYYELVGTTVNSGNNLFTSLQQNETYTSAEIKAVFGVDGFVNAGPAQRDPNNPDQTMARNFLPSLKPSQIGVITNNNRKFFVLTVPVQRPGGLRTEINPWHYLSTGPTNNPATFDLWAEILIGHDPYIIGNWKN